MSEIEIHPHMATLTGSSDDNWQGLCPDSPFFNPHFLGALETTGCVTPDKGWTPQHLSLHNGTELTGLLPVYLKQHSYGEFVFDFAWANASHQAGIPYYPKLVTAIPFTPVTGPRLAARSQDDLQQLLGGVEMLARETQASSWHLLFADESTCASLHSCGSDLSLLERHDCHFVWHNRGYRDFDDFLETFSSRKRKNLRKERRRMQEQGVELKRWSGGQISAQLMEEFYRFYELTYLRRGQPPYLTAAFFQYLQQHLTDSLMLVTAHQQQQLVGAALFMVQGNKLCGRWWGGLPDIDCLHFEACYYQGIEHAIAAGLQYFDPGIQGEHKLLRGFEPVLTRSLHWLKEPALQSAVERWLASERQYIAHYQQQVREHLPFKQSTHN